MTHKIPTKEIIKQINHKKPDLVSIQVPEGLKRKAHKITKEIENKTKANAFISGDPCYGACDIEDSEMKKIGVDLIIHIGHTEIPMNTEIPVLYFEAPHKLNIDGLTEKAKKKLKNNKVGLITTAQHHKLIPKIKRKLEEAGIKTTVGEGDRSIKHPGQVLGCNFSATEIDVDKYLFIGTGNFHPTGVAYSTDKPVIIMDPEMNEVREIRDTDRFIKKRYAAIAKAQEADSIGIILCTKTGQIRREKALEIKNNLQQKDIDTSIITMDEVSPERLMQFSYDAYINTGCPRITYDDQRKYRKPILSPKEHKILIEEQDWEDLQYDEIRREKNEKERP